MRKNSTGTGRWRPREWEASGPSEMIFPNHQGLASRLPLPNLFDCVRVTSSFVCLELPLHRPGLVVCFFHPNLFPTTHIAVFSTNPRPISRTRWSHLARTGSLIFFTAHLQAACMDFTHKILQPHALFHGQHPVRKILAKELV